jgi:hypothetical protein
MTADTIRHALNSTRSELERLQRVAELLQAALDLTDPTPVPAEPKKLAVIATPPPPAPVEPCPNCGKQTKSNAARAMHVKHCTATPEPVPEPHVVDLAIDGPQLIAGKFFECKTCLYRAGDPQRLAKHTHDQHRRPPMHTERQPTAA